MPIQSLPAVEASEPLLPWLVRVLHPMSRTKVKEWLRDGRILVNGVRTTRHDFPLKPGIRVQVGEVELPPDPLTKAGVRIIYEDDALLIVDKPAGLLTVATDREKYSTTFALLMAWSEFKESSRPYVVHRLDRETSGLLVFARSPEVRDRLQNHWQEVLKTYLAVCSDIPDPPEGTIDNHLAEGTGNDLRVRVVRPDKSGAKQAISRYKVLANHGKHALVEVVIETGRKHQIRVHMAGIGCPVVGDRLYGPERAGLPRLALHAYKLAFPHPLTGVSVEFASALPEGFPWHDISVSF